MKKLAIMQPYLFPYIGYFQLINNVDTFVIYDDVNFIKQGWINRNRILVNNNDFLFSVPVVNISSHKLIKETEISYKIEWRDKLLKTFRQAYNKAPFYNDFYPLIESVFLAKEQYIANLALNSIKVIIDYLKITTNIEYTSAKYNNDFLCSQDRVLDICKKEEATNYVNTAGGVNLYDKNYFLKKNVNLNFIKPNHIEYKQFKNDFVPWLSIIDVLMFNSPEQANNLLNVYELI